MSKKLKYGTLSISGWLLSCIFFVFGALLAYAALLYKKFHSRTPHGAKVLSVKPKDALSKVPLSQEVDNVLQTMNFRCMWLFIALFAFFNATYWAIVLFSWWNKDLIDMQQTDSVIGWQSGAIWPLNDYSTLTRFWPPTLQLPHFGPYHE